MLPIPNLYLFSYITNCIQRINLPLNGRIYVLIMFRNLRNPNFCLGRTILKRTKRKGKKHRSSKRISLIYHMTNTTLQRTVSIFQAQTFYVSYPTLVSLNIQHSFLFQVNHGHAINCSETFSRCHTFPSFSLKPKNYHSICHGKKLVNVQSSMRIHCTGSII